MTKTYTAVDRIKAAMATWTFSLFSLAVTTALIAVGEAASTRKAYNTASLRINSRAGKYNKAGVRMNLIPMISQMLFQ